MQEPYNSDTQSSGDVKTSSDDGRDSKTSGDSQQQSGQGVVADHDKEPSDPSDQQQEYIDDVNNNTEAANENPVQDGQGLTMSANLPGEDDDDDDDEDDDDDDDGDDPEIIGDDPAETKKKLPVM